MALPLVLEFRPTGCPLGMSQYVEIAMEQGWIPKGNPSAPLRETLVKISNLLPTTDRAQKVRFIDQTLVLLEKDKAEGLLLAEAHGILKYNLLALRNK